MNSQLKEMFLKVDSMSTDGFVSYLADDVKFRFGNAPELVGKDSVRDGVEAFFSNILGLQHFLVDEWHEAETAILRFDTHYIKKDRNVVVLPCCVILHFNGEDLIDDYRIYADVSPLFDGSLIVEDCLASA